MKKVVKILVILLTILSFNKVYAFEYRDDDIVRYIESFVEYMNNGDETIYGMLDENNPTLNSKTREYLGKMHLLYTGVKVKKVNDGYQVSGIIDADGGNWSVRGFKVTFDIKIDYENDDLVITNTNLYDKVGTENVAKFLIIIFGIIVATVILFISSGTIIALINKRKNKELYQGL